MAYLRRPVIRANPCPELITNRHHCTSSSCSYCSIASLIGDFQRRVADLMNGPMIPMETINCLFGTIKKILQKCVNRYSMLTWRNLGYPTFESCCRWLGYVCLARDLNVHMQYRDFTNLNYGNFNEMLKPFCK